MCSLWPRHIPGRCPKVPLIDPWPCGCPFFGTTISARLIDGDVLRECKTCGATWFGLWLP